ncbi:hypothetical protein LGIHADK_01826 [Mannheimia haemolytica]
MFRPLFICMQKIFPETLQFSLNKGLQPFYLLTGNDLLLVNETKDAIIHTARLNGFDEKKKLKSKTILTGKNFSKQLNQWDCFLHAKLWC